MPAAKSKASKPQTRPAHTGELCADCGVYPLDASATHFSCEHGSWDLSDTAGETAPPEPSEEELRMAALATLGLTEEQVAALTAQVS